MWRGAALAGLLLASPALAFEAPGVLRPDSPLESYCLDVAAEDAEADPINIPPIVGCVAPSEAQPRQRMYAGWSLTGAPSDGHCYFGLLPDPGQTAGRVIVGKSVCLVPALLKGAVRWRLDGEQLSLLDPEGQVVIALTSVSPALFRSSELTLARSIHRLPPSLGPGRYSLQLEGSEAVCSIDFDARFLGLGWSARPDKTCVTEFGLNPGEELWTERPSGTVILGRKDQITFPLTADGVVQGKLRSGRAVTVTKYWGLAVPLQPEDFRGGWAFLVMQGDDLKETCHVHFLDTDRPGLRRLQTGNCRPLKQELTSWSLDAAGQLRLHTADGKVALLLWQTTDGYEGRSEEGDVYLGALLY